MRETGRDPLVAVQRAALERSLLETGDTSEYVVLAAALERARVDDDHETSWSPGDEVRPGDVPSGDDVRPGDADVSPGEATGDPVPGPLGRGDDGASQLDTDALAGTLLTATMTALAAVRHGRRPSRPPTPPGPGEPSGRRERLLLEGALLAHDRMDLSVEEVATLAELPVTAVERRLAARE
jgi:hypothetical protein